MHFSTLALPLLSLVASVYGADPVIISPSNGTHIAPGAAFDFSYGSIADYGASSYNYTVWLLTGLPTSLLPSETWGTGHYFGRFAQPNYPGNPNPHNTPPAQLIMPAFSKPQGGFGSGASIANATFYLAVVEEYATGEPSVGNRFSLVTNQIIYNATN